MIEGEGAGNVSMVVQNGANFLFKYGIISSEQFTLEHLQMESVTPVPPPPLFLKYLRRGKWYKIRGQWCKMIQNRYKMMARVSTPKSEMGKGLNCFQNSSEGRVVRDSGTVVQNGTNQVQNYGMGLNPQIDNGRGAVTAAPLILVFEISREEGWYKIWGQR